MVGTAIVGQVGVNVRPVFTDTQRQIGRQFTGAGREAGGAFNNSFTNALATGAKVAGAVGLAALGTTLTQGFKRLTAMEDAKAALGGLGYEAKDVDLIMKDVEASLGDTIFRFADGAKIAAGALAAGIEPGEELEGFLRLTADAATQAGVEFNDMGQIMARVEGDGRLMGDSVQQLAQNGIYVLPMLAEEFGVTGEEMRKMVSNGEIDSETFRRVMEENIGGSAANAAETTRGALSLAWSSVGQLGEALIKDLMPHIRDSAMQFRDFMQALQPVAIEIGEKLLPVVSGLLGFLTEHPGVIFAAIGAVTAFTVAWWSYRAAMAAVKVITDAYATSVAVAKGAKDAYKWSVTTATAAWKGFTGILSFGNTLLFLSGQYTKIAANSMWRYATGVNVAAVAQRVLNAAMKANLIGVIITAVVALVGALVWFFTQTELGQQIWAAAWEGIKNALAWAWDAMQPVFQWIGEAAQAVGGWFSWLWRDVIVPAWDGIVSAITVAGQWIADVFGSIVSGVQDFLAPVIAWLAPFFQFYWAIISETVRIAWAIIETIFHVIVKVITDILAPAFVWFYENVIQPVWNAITSAISWAWENGIRVIFDAISGFVSFLGTMFTWFYISIIQPIWNGISTAISFYWNNVILPVFNAISAFVSFLGDVFNWFYTNVIQPVWNFISTAIKFYWDNVIRPAFQAIADFVSWLGEVFNWFYDKVIEPVWTWISDKIKEIWENNIKPVFQALGDFISDTVAPLFEKGVEAIKDAWDMLKDIAKAPIDFIINTVINDGLIGALNKVREWVDLDPVDPVSIPGFATGGYTGPGGKYEPAGVVHRGEFVLNKESTNRLRDSIGLSGLNHINRTGRLPGYSSGGLVRPVDGPLTSRFGPRWGSHHSGVDWAVPTGTPVRAALDGTVARAGWNVVTGRTGIGMLLAHPGNRNTYYGHLSRLAARVGDSVSQGEPIALSGNTGNSTGPHLHFETWTGGRPVDPLSHMGGLPASDSGGEGGGGFASFLMSPLRSLVDGLADSVRGVFPGDGEFVNMAVEAGRSTLHNVVDWAQEKLQAIGDFFTGGDSDGGPGPAKDQVRDVAARYGWDSGSQWDALDKLIQAESSWNVNAANPNSTARGLFQKMTSIHGPVADNAAGQAEWGLDYINGRYGSPMSAWMHHRQRGWYADGGLVTSPDHYLFRDQGGSLPPGLSMVLNNTGSNEHIFNQSQLATLDRAVSGVGAGVTINGDVWAHSPEQVAHEIHKDARRAAALAPVL